MDKKKVDVVCSVCKGVDEEGLNVSGNLSWEIETQQWVVEEVYDTYCFHCESVVELEDVDYVNT